MDWKVTDDLFLNKKIDVPVCERTKIDSFNILYIHWIRVYPMYSVIILSEYVEHSRQNSQSANVFFRTFPLGYTHRTTNREIIGFDFDFCFEFFSHSLDV